MRMTTVHAGKRFELISYGNGLSYELKRTIAHAVRLGADPHESVYVQGDEAARFEGQREGWERLFPEADDDTICAMLWGHYASDERGT